MDSAFMIDLVVSTLIIATDLLVIFTAIRSGEIRRQLVLYTIFLAMCMDILAHLNDTIHDFPSYMLNEDIFKTPQAAFPSILVLCGQWFGQLFVLLVLSLIHFIAIFFPALFRAISTKSIHIINLSVIMVSVLLTIPLFTPYCGFSYFTKGHYWSFDMGKPYTHIYWTFNIVLQIVSAVVMAFVDSIIIWKLYQLRRVSRVPWKNASASTSVPKLRNEGRISREMHLALNFLLLSGCFLAQTITYNLPLEKGLLRDVITKPLSKLNLAKWAVYAFGSAAIRNGILRLFKCHRTDPVMTTTILTRTL